MDGRMIGGMDGQMGSTSLTTPESVASEAIIPHDLELASEISP